MMLLRGVNPNCRYDLIHKNELEVAHCLSSHKVIFLLQCLIVLDALTHSLTHPTRLYPSGTSLFKLRNPQLQNYVQVLCKPNPAHDPKTTSNSCGRASHASSRSERYNVAVRIQGEEIIQHRRCALLGKQLGRLLVTPVGEFGRPHLLLDAHELLVQHPGEQLLRHSHAWIQQQSGPTRQWQQSFFRNY